MTFLHAALVAILSLALASCAQPHQMTMRNDQGSTVLCKAPDNHAELSADGKDILVEWCGMACDAHGYRWIAMDTEDPILVTDAGLGTRERKFAEQFLPPQCLPFDPGPMGIVRMPGETVPDCRGILLRDGKCPE